MKRREALQTIGTALAVAGSVLAGVAAPVTAVAARVRRVPGDILQRIRRRTRPLKPETLNQPHDLAG